MSIDLVLSQLETCVLLHFDYDRLTYLTYLTKITSDIKDFRQIKNTTEILV